MVLEIYLGKGYAVEKTNFRKIWGRTGRFEVDNGRRVKFWHDVWCDDMPLKDSFPSLFTFAIAKEAWVDEVREVEEGMVTWSPCFSRNFHDRELDVVNNFFLKLSEFGRFREEEDKMVWKATKNGVFSVRSFYNALENMGEVTFPSKMIWNSWAPTKQILLWIESVPKITIAYRGSRVHASTLSDLLLLVLCVGKTRARDAALNAIQSPLLDIGIERATGIVWNITGGSDLTLFEVNAAAEVIYDLVDPSANLIFGAVIDPSLSGQVSITLIATGFKRQEENEGRPLQASQLAQGDANFGMSRRPSFTEGGSVEIPEFLKKKGRSRYPRA
ncbi:Cell division protein FtsZ-like 2-2, chloroplastic [Vitis vinifera]|uniref:Cell division protein FtsZ-like 2-2, chloroplastic n=1 Tax=Vitis vinifera TaxID=29760 RepID=A0A438EK21_VITVI|nr:Cell division protein FtsZ-like 2-2, chloroplastic [Vitis vinifera]